MPRLLFTGLPADLTTSSLTEILANPPKGVSSPFDSNPRPTDVKVLLSQLGRSRRMAFVGYKSLEQATWIKDVWEGVWLDGRSGGGTGSRISVEWAKSIETTRPINTASNSIPLNPPKKKFKLDTTNIEKPKDAQFEEFMTLSNPRKNKSLVNEIVEVSVPATPHQPTNLPVPQERVAVPTTTTTTTTLESSSDRSSSPPPVIGDDDQEMTDKEYLARRMKRKLTDIIDQEPDLQEVNLPEPASKEWDQEDEQPTKIAEQLKPDEPVVPKDEATILESGRLFLRNLAFSVTEEELREIFEPYGNLTQVHILLDQGRKPKGLGYISYDKPNEALEAYRKLDQTDFQGRLLHILPAVTRNSRPDHPVGQVHNTVKFDQDTKRKLESSKQFNWASLYMNSDAVASSIADRLKISKSDLYDPEASNPAIKLALAETHVINETKQFLEENGIDVEAFEGLKTGRSMTTILVKNIPYNTSTNVIKALFSEHGSVIKVLMPPSGTIAIVEMADKEDAKSAFRSLSYKRIGNSVLYLEKAPLDLWKIKPTTVVAAGEGEVTTNPEKSLSKEDAEGEAGSTLFVKNLSFGTTPESLASKFSHLNGYLFARIQTKPDPKNPSNRLSMGFGFVGFRTAQTAQFALSQMQNNCYLDGHSLQLNFAKRGKESTHDEDREDSNTTTIKDKKTSNKLLIKNLPFEINKKELHELFGVYGKLKSIRIPKKIDKKSRGFGFIEYHTKKEASEALKSLKFSHLLGRHMVIEFATDSNNSSTLDIGHLRKNSTFLLDSGNLSHQKKKFVGLDNNAPDNDVDDDDQD
ncbi:hypothetical protein Pst134EA_017744 [Puccinia striiformis f. sp. tritici]|uniref:hypothetical protein n=1 Tax=Puccinia striiformis f. sp. tritici TaxID=168172 RepID=UPI00200724F2|nr:hypothetical protein Pst134EA_017744 [Puccinia striiformis f. sp. tritici]KAH9461437.1 hypothetical protein Pst134EA_017744 [Puccinia striiformis f. sp. tritici]